MGRWLSVTQSAADRCIALGHALEDDGDFAGALARYREAIGVAPDYAPAYMNAGNALGGLGRWDEALEAQRKAVECAPEYARAHFNLGAFLFNRGRLAEATAELLEASRLQPDMTEAPLLLADVYEMLERSEDAERQYRQALLLAPDHAGAMVNFGWFCVRQGRMEEASQWLQRAKIADPDVSGLDGQILFALNFRADLSPEQIATEHFRLGKATGGSATSPFSFWPNTIDPARRIHVGYVSGDFGPHPVAFFLRPILEHHDRSQFEVFGYSNSSQSNSIEPTLRERSDHWQMIAQLDDAQVVDRIRRDRIDILVDLSGHTSRNRLSVFARHPAPVQVSWLGYLNTTGMPAMDYRITDAHTDPEGMTEHLHTERLVRMPHSQWCYFASEEIDTVGRPHDGETDAIVFGSFNQYAKITDSCLALWAQVLARVPDSKLLVFDVRQAGSANTLRSKMSALGIDPERIRIYGRVPLREYFAAIGNVDIALDAYPYNGATTTLDALWMGVPVVALRGDRGIARSSYSILRTLGATDLIAQSVAEYVALNERLARDDSWRMRLRQTLRSRLAASPLMDARGFTAALEVRYRAMWQAWCASR